MTTCREILSSARKYSEIPCVFDQVCPISLVPLSVFFRVLPSVLPFLPAFLVLVSQNVLEFSH